MFSVSWMGLKFRKPTNDVVTFTPLVIEDYFRTPIFAPTDKNVILKHVRKSL